MSPGLMALPLGMFSVEGTTAVRVTGSPSLAIASVASITAAPPDMSNFISCILAAGLIEIPPVSNVTALPTKAEMRARRPGRAVAQHDQARVGDAALRHGGERAHAVGDDRVPVEQLDLERLVLVGDLRGALGEERRRGEVGGQVLQVARGVRGAGADAGPLDLRLLGAGHLERLDRAVVVGPATT